MEISQRPPNLLISGPEKFAPFACSMRFTGTDRLPHLLLRQALEEGWSAMASGWARDGAVQDQIDDTVADAVKGARARLPAGESATLCEECGEPIPERRREALPGVRTCVACQSERDAG